MSAAGGQQALLDEQGGPVGDGFSRSPAVLRPLHLLLSDVAVLVQSPFSTTGCATTIGKHPVKDCCEAMGRLMVG